ncbi:MAG: hypothetical protein AB8H03_14490 [Saprospiraceae bacterium]
MANKKKKLQTKKTGAGDPTLGLLLMVVNEDSTPVEEETIPLDIEVTIGEDNQRILSLPFANLPPEQDISLMAGFDDSSLDFSQGETIPLVTTISVKPRGDFEISIEDLTGLNGTIKNDKITFERISNLSPGPTALQTSLGKDIVLQSREGEDDGIGTDGVYIFLAYNNPSQGILNSNKDLVTDCYFVSSESSFVWVIENISDDSYTLFNKKNQKYLGYNGSLDWISQEENIGNQIYWKINPSTNENYPYSFNIQSENAMTLEGVNNYLTATPTTYDGNIKLEANPSPWFFHDNLYS